MDTANPSFTGSTSVSPSWTYSEVLQKSWDGIKGNLPFTAALSLVFSVAIFVVSYIPILGWILVAPLSVGYVKCLMSVRRGDVIDYKDFFWGFLNFNRYLNLVLLNVLLYAGTILGFLLLIIPGIWFSVMTSLATVIAVLKDDNDAIAALRGSMNIVKVDWWKYAGLLGVIFLVNLAGGMCFIIGLLISMPISVLALVTVVEAAGADARPTSHS